MRHTLNSKLCAMLRNQHHFDDNPLADYHAVQAVKNSLRIRDKYARFLAVKTALKSYRVMVNFTADDKARIFCPATKAEVSL
jgi:hypothetical protein